MQTESRWHHSKNSTRRLGCSPSKCVCAGFPDRVERMQTCTPAARISCSNFRMVSVTLYTEHLMFRLKQSTVNEIFKLSFGMINISHENYRTCSVIVQYSPINNIVTSRINQNSVIASLQSKRTITGSCR